MEFFHPDKAREIITSAKGTWFTCYFIKRTNGEVRKFHGRLKVVKGVKGVGLAFDPTTKNLINAWDRVKKSHRFINLETVAFIRVRKVGYFPNETIDLKKNSISITLGKI